MSDIIATKLAVINIALKEFGILNVTKTSDDVVAERLNQRFDATYMRLLSEYNWGFAKAYQKLTQPLSTSTFPDEWNYSFVLPANYIKTYKTYPDYARYELAGGTLNTNEAEFGLYYIAYDVATINQWPMPFIYYMAYTLAADDCLIATERLDLKQDLMLLAEQYRTKAKTFDKFNNYVEGAPYNDYDRIVRA